MIYLVTNQQTLFESENYEILSLENAINLLESCDKLQVDTETTGRDAHINRILTIQFGNKQKDFQIVVDAETVDVRKFKNILENKFLILQNAKFDLQFLYSLGIIPRRIYDTMIAEQLLYLGFPNGRVNYSLNAIAFRRLNINIDKTVRGEIIWRGLDDAVITYAAGDVTYLEDIMESQWKDLVKNGLTKAVEVECKFIPSLAYMEWCGINLDADKWKAKMKQDEEDLDKAKRNLDTFVASMASKENNNSIYVEEPFLISTDSYAGHKDYPLPEEARIIEGSQTSVTSSDTVQYNYVRIRRKFPFCAINTQGDLFTGFDLTPKCVINWDSPKQVVAFVKYLGFDTTVQDKKTGNDKDSILEKVIMRQKGINDEFLSIYFDYREHAKVCSTYGQGHLNMINPKTGRIHTVFRQLGAHSGRMSCGSTNPNTDLAKAKGIPAKECTYHNLQQLPSNEETRSCFTAPRGYKFVSCDYSAEESRLGADIYQDKEFLREFKEGSGDTHNMFAWIVYNKECRELGCQDATEVKKKAPQWRKKVKGFEFGYMFGGAAPTLAASAGCSVEEAQAVIDKLDKAFAGMTDFARKGSRAVRENGYILINPITGHKLYWWDHKEWKERQKSFTPEFWESFRKSHKGTGDDVALMVRKHFQAASKYDRLARNVVTQGTGAIILKTAMTNLFNWIVDNNYFNIIHICVAVHDEINCDYPEKVENFPEVLKTIMENAAAEYCKSLPIPADPAVGDHWIH